jgi:hypothetical protein
MDSHGENSIHNLPYIADFRLECCILMEIAKNKTSGRSIHGKPLSLLGDCFMPPHPSGQERLN